MDPLRLYHALPLPLQNLGITAYGVMLDRRYYGREYERWCSLLDNQERWPMAKICEWQMSAVRCIINSAARHVPHYRHAFQHCHPRALAPTTPADLRLLPMLDKETVRQAPQSLLDERLDLRRLHRDRTSGSTGTPLLIYWPKAMLPKWWAIQERRVRRWAGVAQGMPRAMIGARPIVRGNSKGPYWRYNYFWKQLYMSAYHISPSTSQDYVGAMQRYGSRWITGYGSSIALLGHWLCDHHARQPHIAAVVTSGDDLLPSHRKAIEQGFSCRVFDNYGSTEGCLVISECEHGRMHLQPETGLLEILDDAGNPCPPGEIGEMVATGLLNDAMPLIRYRTGDTAAWSTEVACPCGRQSPIIRSIAGRRDDYLLLPDGRRIARLSTPIKKALTIRSAQIVQDSADHAWLLVVPGSGYRDTDGEAIRDDILSRLGPYDLEVRTVDAIPKTSAGKQRFVVRLCDRPPLAKQYDDLLPEISWRC